MKTLFPFLNSSAVRLAMISCALMLGLGIKASTANASTTITGYNNSPGPTFTLVAGSNVFTGSFNTSTGSGMYFQVSVPSGLQINSASYSFASGNGASDVDIGFYVDGYDGPGSGSFPDAVGLQQGTYSANISGGISVGNTWSITINTGTLPATVGSLQSASDTTGGITLSATEGNASSQGFVYSLTSVNSNPQINGTGVTQVAATASSGAFSTTITSLPAGTSYSYAAYAINGGAPVYTTPVGGFATMATGLTVHDFETDVNVTSFSSSGQTWTLTGQMNIYNGGGGGGGAPTNGGAVPASSGYMAVTENPVSTGNVGGIAAPTGYTFRAVSFDVWPSNDDGNDVYGGGQDTLGTVGLKYTVIGKKGGTQVVTANVTDTARTPAETGTDDFDGYWHHIDLSGTAFATTDIDTVEFVIVAQTGAAMNYLAVDNFVYSNFGLVAVNAAPVVTTNPNSTTVNAGSNTSFTAAASGTPTPSVQWQVNTGSGFTTLGNGGVYSGATTGTLTITGATVAMNGYQYEAVFTNTVNSATTTAATLTVDSAPAITGSPSNHTISAGGSTSFTASASGNPTPSVQWQVSTNNGSSYNNVSNIGVYSNATTTTLNITNAPPSMGGYKYQAVFSNTLFGAGSPSTATSGAATLTFNAPTVAVNTGTLAANAGGVTITGTGFDPVPLNNSVSFTDGAVGTVSSASLTSLTVTFSTKPTKAGSLTAIVTTDTQNSGSAVQVATIIPVVTTMTTNVGINSTTVTINGFGFDTTDGNNIITLSDGATGHVVSATATSLTVQFDTDPTVVGPLTASVSTDGQSSGAAVQVGTVVPVVQFSVASEIVDQSAGTFTVTATMTGASATTTFASGLNSPTDVATDASGNVYVTDYDDGTVAKYNASGTLINASFISGSAFPYGIALDSSGNIYLATGSARIEKYNSSGTLINANYITGLNHDGFLAFDSSNNLYVTSGGLGTVLKYNSVGTLINANYITGLNNPIGLAFDASGNLYVGNYLGASVSKYDSTGTLINASFMTVDHPYGIATDASGNVYAASNDTNQVVVANSSGTQISAGVASGLSGPSGLAFDPSGNLYIVNGTTNTVTKVTTPTSASLPFTVSGTAVSGTDYSGLSASPLVFGPGQATATITGTLLSDPGDSQTLTFTLGTPTGAVLGTPATNTLTIIEPPLVTSSTASLPANATTVTINGAGFAPVITGAITGASNASPIVITSANHGLVSGQQVTISGVGGNTAANGTWTITMIDGNTFSLVGSTGNGAYTSGGTWSLVPDDTVVFNDGAVGTVTSLTDTALTVTFSTLPVTAGPLTATVTVNDQSGSTEQVATVIPVITSSTTNFGINGNTLVINGFGFSTTTNTVTFSDGTVGTVSGTPTTTQLTVTISTDPTHVGVLNATVTSNGASSTSTQVATVVPIAGPVTIMRQPTTGVTVTAATITAGVTDPDPTDTLTLISVGTPAHGSTRLLNQQVAYLPAHGWTTGDSFTYTVQDGAGTQISGTVTVGIIGSSGAATMSINNPTVQPGGAVLLTFSGVPNTVYGIQYSATMAVGSWVNLVDVTTDQYGDGQYTDNTHPGVSGFYRLIYPGF